MSDDGKGGEDASSSSGGDSLLRAVAHAPERAPEEPDPPRLAQFRVLGRLGQGGMGIVYRAEDEKLQRLVALKVLPRAVSDDDERRRRFLREARSAAAINHPNVATIYEVDEADGRVFIAMELVEGETLRARLARAPLTLSETVRIARAIARGLARAHARGIVHRDLKPDNVMLDPEGEAKILDFGLAKLREAAGERSMLEVAETESQLTQEGRLFGTPGYMSPEQVRGKQVDARTDVFALGVCLYEMLAGERPFRGGSTMDVLMATSRDPHEPVRAHNAEVPAELAAIVDRCLAKAADERYASARELGDALDGLTVGSEARAPEPRPSTRSLAGSTVGDSSPRRQRTLLAVLGVATALAIGGGLVWRARPPVASSAPAAPAAPPRGVAITDYPPPKTGNPDAAREYALAMQARRDAANAASKRHLLRAVELDPSFALPHVWLAWDGPGSLDERRKHLAAAVGLRGELGERDAAILEVLQALLRRDQPDVDDARTRWKSLAEQHPLDAALVDLAGEACLDAGHKEEGFALLDRAVALDPKFALPYLHRADFQMYGDLDDAVASANRCLSLSPSAASCLGVRAGVEQRLGQCARLEEDARAMIALEPDSESAYSWLEAALIARGAPLESIAEARHRAAEHAITPAARAQHEAYDPWFLTWLNADFTAQVEKMPALDRYLAAQTSDSRVGAPVGTEIIAFEEAGLRDRAVAIAEAYLKRLPALTPDSPRGGRNQALWIRRLAGRLTDADFRAEREKWAQDTAAKTPPRLAALGWFFFYAGTAETASDAREALEALPRYSPLFTFDGMVYNERVMGRVLQLVGRLDEAIPHLRRAVASCFSPDSFPSHQWAARTLGEALEAKGDTKGACDAFGEVLAHWGNAKPRSITADAARAHMKKLGCAR